MSTAAEKQGGRELQAFGVTLMVAAEYVIRAHESGVVLASVPGSGAFLVAKPSACGHAEYVHFYDEPTAQRYFDSAACLPDDALPVPDGCSKVLRNVDTGQRISATYTESGEVKTKRFDP